MALAVDSSTPALVTAADDPWTSASFTPPNDSLLVVKVMADWFTSGTPLIAVTSTGLTFERIGRIGAASQGLTEIWIAKVGSNGGSARTVSATTTITDDSGGIKVEVWTGFNPDDPIDAFVCQANNTTNSISPACVTTTDNAWLTGGGVDWQNLGAATSSDTNEHGEPGGVAILSVRKSAATSPAGSPTLNFDASGTGTPLWTWAILALRADTADPSPIYKVADRGSTQNLTAETSTAVDLPAAGSITVDNYLIARVALDNTGASGAATTLAVSDARNGSWTVTAAGNADPGAASAGSTCYIAYVKAASGYTNGDDVTFTYGNSTTAKSIVIEEWFGIHKTTPVAVAATTTSGATATGSISRTPTAAGQLVYGALSYEGVAADQITSDPDQTDGSWLLANQLSTTSGTAANNQTVVGIYKRVTGTSAQTWNVALPAARDWGAVMLVFDAEPADTGTDASAGDASGTGLVDASTRTVATGSAASTAVGAAQEPSPSIKASAGTATATGVADNATISTAGGTNAQAGEASATGAASNPSGSITASIGAAGAAGEAQTPTTSVRPTPTTAAATGEANNPTVQTGSFTNAQAGVATGSGTANAPSTQAVVNAAPAAATATANNPASAVGARAGNATGSSAANQPAVTRQAFAQAECAVATGVMLTAMLRVLATAEAAVALAVALDPLAGAVLPGTAHAATGLAPTAGAAVGAAPTATTAAMTVPTATGA